MADDAQRPIIIRRKKKRSAGHHGGAWKIAYADFVTAMMAFFLLMWLLGSTAQGDLEGIADHFLNPLKVSMQGGSGSGDSSSVIKGGGEDLSRAGGGDAAALERGDDERRRRGRPGRGGACGDGLMGQHVGPPPHRRGGVGAA